MKNRRRHPSLTRRLGRGATAVLVLVATTDIATAQSDVPYGEWHAFGRDGANTKYSPLDEITADNFTDLEIAWRWTSLSKAVVDSDERIRPRQFNATPLMIDGLVYIVTALGQVAALDAGTGEPVWDYDPRIYDDLERPPNMGWHHRGLSYWDDPNSDDGRIFIASHDLRLVALNARTGGMYPDFGLDGYVDLGATGYEREIDRSRMTYSSPVAVIGDTIIVGSIIQDTRLTLREANPGHVRAFDARTGDLKWVFRTIPQGDDYGIDSWGNESWRYSGHTNVWSYMAVDEELGYVYLPTGTPSNDWYGGMRPGNNLFAESIVAVDVETGERVWHFQAIHHGLWDWDFPTGPNLLDITVDGREIKALAQVSKQGFTYVFNRVTGEPVWPIEERTGAAGQCAGRVVFADAAVSDQAATVRPARRHSRRFDRLHPGAAGRGCRDCRPRAVRADLFAASPARRREAVHSGAGRRRRGELAGGGGRPGDGAALHLVVEHEHRRRGDQIRPAGDRRILYRPVGGRDAGPTGPVDV